MNEYSYLRHIPIALAFCLLCGCLGEPSGPKRLTKQQFSEIYAEEAAKRFPQAEIEIVDDLELRVKMGDRTLQASIENHWYTYEDGDLQSNLDDFAAMLTDGFDEEELKAEAIVPTIRTQEYIQGNAPGVLAAEEFVGDLWVVYSEDGPTSIRPLSWSEIDEAKIDRATLRQLAVDNFLRIAADWTVDTSGGARMIVAGGDYEASFLLADFIWDQEEKQVAGELMMVVPNRDVVVFAGSEESAQLRMVVEELRRTGGSFPLSDKIFVRRDGEWVVWDEWR